MAYGQDDAAMQNLAARKKPIPAAPACASEAAQFHGVNIWVLRAIIWQESSNRSSLVTRNTNNSLDVGHGGINSVHFPELQRYGVAPEKLLDPCVNTYVAAWHLAKQMRSFGNSWSAVAAYHSRTPAKGVLYAQKIQSILADWQIVSN